MKLNYNAIFQYCIVEQYLNTERAFTECLFNEINEENYHSLCVNLFVFYTINHIRSSLYYNSKQRRWYRLKDEFINVSFLIELDCLFSNLKDAENKLEHFKNKYILLYSDITMMEDTKEYRLRCSWKKI